MLFLVSIGLNVYFGITIYMKRNIEVEKKMISFGPNCSDYKYELYIE